METTISREVTTSNTEVIERRDEVGRTFFLVTPADAVCPFCRADLDAGQGCDHFSDELEGEFTFIGPLRPQGV